MGEYEVQVVTTYRVTAANTEAAHEQIRDLLKTELGARSALKSGEYIGRVQQADRLPEGGE